MDYSDLDVAEPAAAEPDRQPELLEPQSQAGCVCDDAGTDSDSDLQAPLASSPQGFVSHTVCEKWEWGIDLSSYSMLKLPKGKRGKAAQRKNDKYSCQ